MQVKSSFRVVHICPHSAQLSGGHTNAILTFMEGQKQQGLEIRGLCPFGRDIPAGLRVPVEQVPMQEMDFEGPDFCGAALAAVADSPRALYHFHGFVPAYLKLGRSLRQAGIPYLITSQGQLHYRDPLHWLKKFVYLNLVIRLFRQASALHFVTRQERIRCRRLLPMWRKPVLVQQNVVKVPEPAQVRGLGREQYGLPSQAVVFGYLGRLHIEHKGLDLLIQGFARVPAEANCYLVLIGPDWEGGRQRLEGLASQLGCEGRVRFLGPQVGEVKWQMLKMADAFISPSRWDACPSAVTEAIGFGLPTIVSSTMNPAPELAEAGAAVAAEPTPAGLAQAMQQMAGDRAFREALGPRGRQWVLENCSLPVAGRRFERFYQDILQQGRS